MTEAQKIECVNIGIRHKADEEEIAHWLYGESKEKLTHDEQLALLEPTLKECPNEWQWKVLGLIEQIPEGHLISYGNLARWAKKELGLDITPRNTAWLRKKIYWMVGHDTEIPIHRVASDGDTKSTRDHAVTRNINRHKRGAEGSLNNPVWLQK